jgi:Zn2+/Cd2+-exporting ATPase
MKEIGEGIFEGPWYTHPSIRNAIVSGLLTSASFILSLSRIAPFFFSIAIYLVAIMIGGYYWVKEGAKKLFEERKVGIEILMMAATLGSAILGLWDEAAFLVFLYGAAEGVEEFTFARTRGSIRRLLDLAPKKANVLKDGQEANVDAAKLKIGDLFIVRPGESVPTDGIVVKGRSTVNEAPVTGESLPVEKLEKMKVFAGTINQEGVLEVEASAAFEDNTLSKIIRLVEEAQEEKGAAQLFIERFGSVYSPIVLLSSLLLVTLPFFFGFSLLEWSERAIVLLVAASPCALIMSTPVAIATGIGKAGRSGVLIKGGAHLENLGRIKTVAFDKTSTLTEGRTVVKDVVSMDGDTERALCLCYSIERFSQHPVARAVIEKAKQCNLQAMEVTEFESLTGSGVKAKIGGREVYAGKPEMFRELGVDVQNSPVIEKLRNEGNTVIAVGTTREVECAIAIGDNIRPQAREVVTKLRAMGIRTVMLTGDNEITAKAVAGDLGLDEVRANLKPEDKIEAVKELERLYGAVAMVGDGVNDAPALAQATVGIAMGAAGTDAAIEAADIALMSDDLSQIPFAINLGKKAREISRQNVSFSLLILAILIPSALIGLMSVAVAVFLHEASELMAVANGLRVGKD